MIWIIPTGILTDPKAYVLAVDRTVYVDHCTYSADGKELRVYIQTDFTLHRNKPSPLWLALSALGRIVEWH